MKIIFDRDDLRPLVEQIVSETIERLTEERAQLAGPLSYHEPEAAKVTGFTVNALRDLRVLGEIPFSKIGKRIVYSRRVLIELLEKTQQTN